MRCREVEQKKIEKESWCGTGLVYVRLVVITGRNTEKWFSRTALAFVGCCLCFRKFGLRRPALSIPTADDTERKHRVVVARSVLSTCLPIQNTGGSTFLSRVLGVGCVGIVPIR